MNHNDIRVLFGPPGTGKTTSIINIVKQAVAEGVHPSRIACLTFTVKAATEIKERICLEFPGLSQNDFPYFRTLHSLAYMQLRLNSKNVLNRKRLQEFNDHLGGGFEFKHRYGKTTERFHAGGGLGDKCLQVYGLSKSTGRSCEDIWKEQDDLDINWSDMRHFVDELERYKKDNMLLDFTDFLIKSRTPIDVDLFIIDEAQDNTPLEWAYASAIASNARKVIIAGDDDQSIFEWSGADIKHLLNVRGVKEVLPVSYRLPRQIYDFSNKIVNRIRTRHPKSWEPRNEDGDVFMNVGSPYSLDVDSGSWLLLGRCNHHLTKFEEMCRTKGLGYKIKGKASNDTKEATAVLTYELLRKGKAVEKNNALLMAKFISDFDPEIILDRVVWDDLEMPMSRDSAWFDSLDLMDKDEMYYLRAMLFRKESIIREPRIVIDTIHSVKGGEADHVALLPDQSRKIKMRQHKDPDQEHRVFYVGATRARKTLSILQPEQEFYYEELMA